ncbi:KRI1 family protein [Aspergillus candidus]|uniref:Krr1-domain-containing protein n=1 Tax=Aspergillus candidus TaxID=41067 RepID=A0A2I2FMY0_ASPCN|nr:Krr1-domain-containing protein [Aspergillus candidus]PLB41971.1 Krr1-domain-containing protein [Aspergillus candidus]
MEPPAKKSRMLLDDSSSDDSGDESGGVTLNTSSDKDFKIKVNEEYARRFEYNKKREELAKLEAKHGSAAHEESEEDSEDDVEEDDEAELATEALDAEIMDTLNAIRSKDPRVYDANATFYHEGEEDGQPGSSDKKEKPMTLRDYHRKTLLSGAHLADEDEDAPKTYAQEQEDLKMAIVKEMHASGDQEASEDDEESDEDNLLVAKSAPERPSASKADVKLDVENADKDPESFLSNFMSARAWLPTNRSELKPFESDDEDEDQRAEAFEEAYNFRFEDPNKMNTVLITHSRDAINQQTVRRDEKSGRKKIRDLERQRKEEEKKQRETEKNRLRKLKAEELQNKVNKIKEVAGIRASQFTDDDWTKFLDGSWDDKDWEKEMQKRFGDDYYAEGDGIGSDEEGGKKRKHPKKPTWDDDIDIKDLVPDFEDDEKPTAGLSDVEMGDDDNDDSPQKSKAQERRDAKREARKDKLRIEEALDRTLDLDITLLPGATKKNATRFRYRETSPESFGLTARDILMANDHDLNKYAGLKKLASFREEEKKRKDHKHLGKKARLRQWRNDTFGSEAEPEWRVGEATAAEDAQEETTEGKVDIRGDDGEPRKKKRKRSKKN